MKIKYIFAVTFLAVCACVLPGLNAQAAPPRAKKAGMPAAKASGKDAPNAQVVGLTITPASVNLSGTQAVQHLLVTAAFRDGSTRDVTDEATFTTPAPKLLAVSQSGEVSGIGDGQGVVAAKWNGKTADGKDHDFRHENAADSLFCQ